MALLQEPEAEDAPRSPPGNVRCRENQKAKQTRDADCPGAECGYKDVDERRQLEFNTEYSVFRLSQLYVMTSSKL